MQRLEIAFWVLAGLKVFSLSTAWEFLFASLRRAFRVKWTFPPIRSKVSSEEIRSGMTPQNTP